MEASKASTDKDSDAIDIFLFSNGQQNTPPRKYHLTRDDLNMWNSTLNFLGSSQYGTLHSDLQLYTIDGQRVLGPQELKDGAAYVTVTAPEHFLQTGYNKYLIKASRSWEKRQLKKAAPCDNTEDNTRKDVQTDDRSIRIPLDNIVVVKKASMNVSKISAPKPIEVKRPSLKSSTVKAALKPVANQVSQRPYSLPRNSGSTSSDRGNKKTVLSKHEFTAKKGTRLPRPGVFNRIPTSDAPETAAVKSVPLPSISRQVDDRFVKSKTSSLSPNSGITKIKSTPPVTKLPPINKRNMKQSVQAHNSLKMPIVKLDTNDVNDFAKTPLSRKINEAMEALVERDNPTLITSNTNKSQEKDHHIPKMSSDTLDKDYKTLLYSDVVDELSSMIENRRISNESLHAVVTSKVCLSSNEEFQEPNDTDDLTQSYDICNEIVYQLDKENQNLEQNGNVKNQETEDCNLPVKISFDGQKYVFIWKKDTYTNDTEKEENMCKISNLNTSDNTDKEQNIAHNTTEIIPVKEYDTCNDTNTLLTHNQQIDCGLFGNETVAIIPNLNNFKYCDEDINASLFSDKYKKITSNNYIMPLKFNNEDTNETNKQSDDLGHLVIEEMIATKHAPNYIFETDAIIQGRTQSPFSNNTPQLYNVNISTSAPSTIRVSADNVSKTVNEKVTVNENNHSTHKYSNANDETNASVLPTQSDYKEVNGNNQSGIYKQTIGITSATNIESNDSKSDDAVIKKVTINSIEHKINSLPKNTTIKSDYLNQQKDNETIPADTNMNRKSSGAKICDINIYDFGEEDIADVIVPRMIIRSPVASKTSLRDDALDKKHLIAVVHKGDIVKLQVNMEVRAANGAVKCQRTLDALQQSSKTNLNLDKEDIINDQLMQRKSLQSMDSEVEPHQCCRTKPKNSLNKCACCNYYNDGEDATVQVLKNAVNLNNQPYYVIVPIAPPTATATIGCGEDIHTSDKEVQYTAILTEVKETLVRMSVENLNMGANKQLALVSDEYEYTHSEMVVLTTTLSQTSENHDDVLKPLSDKSIENTENAASVTTSNNNNYTQRVDASTQTDWCEVLMEARPHPDGHYTFHLPPLASLQQRSQQ